MSGSAETPRASPSPVPARGSSAWIPSENSRVSTSFPPFASSTMAAPVCRDVLDIHLGVADAHLVELRLEPAGRYPHHDVVNISDSFLFRQELRNAHVFSSAVAVVVLTTDNSARPEAVPGTVIIPAVAEEQCRVSDQVAAAHTLQSWNAAEVAQKSMRTPSPARRRRPSACRPSSVVASAHRS